MTPKRIVTALLLALLSWPALAHAGTLENVKARGDVLCGETPMTAGFSATEVNGAWIGLGADYCRALAATIFNDPTKVKFVPLDRNQRFEALVTHKVDALADLVPWTLTGDTDQGVKFVAIMFYDGQGFMVTKAANMKSARDLSGKLVCVEANTPSETNAQDYFDDNNIQAKLDPLAGGDAAAGYIDGTCAALSAPSSALAGIRAGLTRPTDHVLLPDVITKQPLSIVVAQGDDRWFDVARWTFYALLDAEELGITQSNVDEMLGSDNISIRRFLGVEGDFGAAIGLNKDWAYQIIKGVGNYADIYEKDVGQQSPLRLPRGLNALWDKGGIQYSPPIK